MSYYQVDMVRLLLEHNVNIEAKDEAGRTALSSAVLYGREEIVQILLERGADSDSIDNKGWTPFFYAASRPEGAILASLASFNTKGPHHRDQYGQTPLHLAASLGHSQSVRALLATEQIDLELQDDFGCTALSVAASYGSAEIVQLLVEKGAAASSSDKGGRTAFFHAASRSDQTILTSLLRDNINGLNQPDHYGRTPLLVAASFGRLQSVCTLGGIEYNGLHVFILVDALRLVCLACEVYSY